MSRIFAAIAVAALAVVLLAAGSVRAHQVTLLGTEIDVGIADYDGFLWTVELKTRVTCSGADETYIGITFRQIRSYGQVGGMAIVATPPPNVYERRKVPLPSGRYEVRFDAAACHSTAPMGEGHEGEHGDTATNPPAAKLNLPDCRPRATVLAPLVPVVGGPTDMRAQCPARLCDAIGSAARVSPLVPVRSGGPPVPAPCPTVAANGPNVPVEVVCGPGSIAARARPLVPVRGSPCRGTVSLVSVSAGAATASAGQVVGAKRFRIRRGRVLAVKVPLRSAARQRLALTRVLRVRAVVRSKAGRRKSRPFTVVKRR